METTRKNHPAASWLPVCLILLCLVSSVHAETSVLPAPDNSPGRISLYYFKSEGCSHCIRAEEIVRDVASRYPEIRVFEFELSTNATNRQLFATVSREFNLVSPSIPLLIVGNRALVGEYEIRDQLEGIVLEERAATDKGTGRTGVNLSLPGMSGAGPGVTIPLVIGAALIDGINPCALAVLVFLILSITRAGDRRKALAAGLVYTAAVFILYFFAGLGIFAGIRGSGFGQVIYVAAAGIAAGTGILSLRDGLSKKGAPLLTIPGPADSVIRKYATAATLPAAFVLGLLVGLFELPCTGAIYFSVLNLLQNSVTFIEGAGFLLLYNLVFVLPLLLVIAAVYRGLPPSDVEQWRMKNMRRLRLVSGLLLLGLGSAMLVLMIV